MEKLNKFINRTFRRRISAFFIPTIIVLILIISGISYYIYYIRFLEESKKNIQGMVNQGNYTIDLYFQDVKTTIALLEDNEELIHMLNDYDSMSVQERFYQQEVIDKVLRNTSLMREHILDCIIIGENGYQVNLPDHIELKKDAGIIDRDWIRPYLKPENKGFYYSEAHLADYYIKNNDKSVLSVVSPIFWHGNCLGYIIVDLDFLRMNEIVNAGHQTGDFRYLVIDDTGSILFSAEPEDFNKKLPEDARERMQEEDSFFFTYHGKKVFCVHEKSSTTEWEFLVFTPKSRLSYPGLQILQILTLVILPIFIGITVLLSLRIATRVKLPLEEIVEQLKQIDIDHPNIIHVDNSVGEIDYLAGKITEMSYKITNLVNQVYKAELRSKDAQIEALISQINPHFLYNTLQLIKTESIKGHAKEVSETTNCLSSFLRYTIDNKNLYVTMAEELEYIRTYIEIYKKRFPGKYSLIINAEEGTLENIIPKLTLQPIVENAIKHGISKKDGPGVIRITVSDEDDIMVLIEDNGVGLDKGSLDDLLSCIHSEDSSGSHVGLKNVQERLELDGDRYGIIKLESKEGEYFKVYVRIKKGQKNV